MTLILALGNRDFVIHVADRRLTRGSQVHDDDSSKGGVFTCDDAQMLFGFSGLASLPEGTTQRWLLSNLVECAGPDFTAGACIQRLTQRLSELFASPDLLGIPGPDRRLTVMLTGYLYRYAPPLLIQALITNFQDYDAKVDSEGPWRDFRVRYLNEQLEPRLQNPTLIQRIGQWHLLPEPLLKRHRQLLERRASPRALVSRSVALMRHMADHPAARGTVGKSIYSIILPAVHNAIPQGGYHVLENKPHYFWPDQALALSQGMQIAISDMGIKQLGKDGQPGVLTTPQVPKHHPCPCGSGRRYRDCHGRQP